jgi:hypothetical protein
VAHGAAAFRSNAPLARSYENSSLVMHLRGRRGTVAGWSSSTAVDRRSGPSKWVVLAAVAGFAVVATMNAWLSDDAYITLRTVDNFVHGFGMRWNVGERVQAYTHPLWFFLLSGPYAISENPYVTTLAVSLCVSIAAVLIVALGKAGETARCCPSRCWPRQECCVAPTSGSWFFRRSSPSS